MTRSALCGEEKLRLDHVHPVDGAYQVRLQDEAILWISESVRVEMPTPGAQAQHES